MLNILISFSVNINEYSWISVNIKKICRYSHNYGDEYGTNIYPTSE